MQGEICDCCLFSRLQLAPRGFSYLLCSLLQESSRCRFFHSVAMLFMKMPPKKYVCFILQCCHSHKNIILSFKQFSLSYIHIRWIQQSINKNILLGQRRPLIKTSNIMTFLVWSLQVADALANFMVRHKFTEFKDGYPW